MSNRESVPDLFQALTIEEYYVAVEGLDRPLTQDGPYNHSAGDPRRRLTADQIEHDRTASSTLLTSAESPILSPEEFDGTL